MRTILKTANEPQRLTFVELLIEQFISEYDEVPMTVTLNDKQLYLDIIEEVDRTGLLHDSNSLEYIHEGQFFGIILNLNTAATNDWVATSEQGKGFTIQANVKTKCVKSLATTHDELHRQFELKRAAELKPVIKQLIEKMKRLFEEAHLITPNEIRIPEVYYDIVKDEDIDGLHHSGTDSWWVDYASNTPYYYFCMTWNTESIQ